MTARSIWQGTLTIKQQKLPVKLYSAVQDQHVHFHLLHRRDRSRVEQRMIDTEWEGFFDVSQALTRAMVAEIDAW